jgi:putative glutamine amidotransferase
MTALLRSYTDAVLGAGGLPIPIPPSYPEEVLADLYSRLDGILFSGGGDVSAEHFKGDLHPSITRVDPERDFTELTLLRCAAQDGKAMLGICRGIQVMNVALGGTLYTHIPDQLPEAVNHPGSVYRELAHHVHVDESARLARILGETFLHVNSLHHQGLKELAPSLRAAGHSPDGLIEAVELSGHPYAIGVQWHPEWLTDQPAMQRLFASFVDAAA